MYTARDAIRVGEEITNLLDVLKEMEKDYYDISKEHVREALKSIVDVWKILDNETKSKAKKLMALAKKFEE